jgi:hypothetical protein
MRSHFASLEHATHQFHFWICGLGMLSAVVQVESCGGNRAYRVNPAASILHAVARGPARISLLQLPVERDSQNHAAPVRASR